MLHPLVLLSHMSYVKRKKTVSNKSTWMLCCCMQVHGFGCQHDDTSQAAIIINKGIVQNDTLIRAAAKYVLFCVLSMTMLHHRAVLCIAVLHYCCVLLFVVCYTRCVGPPGIAAV